MQSAHGGIESIGDALLDRGRCFAPGNWRRVGPNHPIVLLEHLRARHPEFDAGQIGRSLDRALAALPHGDDTRVNDDIPKRLEPLGFDLRIDGGAPRIRVDEIDEFLIGAAEIRQVDEVNHRRERREIGQRVLGGLNGPVLDLLRQRAAGA